MNKLDNIIVKSQENSVVDICRLNCNTTINYDASVSDGDIIA